MNQPSDKSEVTADADASAHRCTVRADTRDAEKALYELAALHARDPEPIGPFFASLHHITDLLDIRFATQAAGETTLHIGPTDRLQQLLKQYAED